MSGINAPDRTEAFILGDGEKKIEEKIDTRTPNTVIFTFNKEDHTLANMLRAKLLENSHVTFAAYKVPHPLFANFELRIQTDGEITPKEALIASSKEIIKELDVLKHRFKKEYDLRKMVGSVGQNGA
ncbi:DNA-directed RNA polymerase II core subunit [Rhinocladiella similis]